MWVTCAWCHLLPHPTCPCYALLSPFCQLTSVDKPAVTSLWFQSTFCNSWKAHSTAEMLVPAGALVATAYGWWASRGRVRTCSFIIPSSGPFHRSCRERERERASGSGCCSSLQSPLLTCLNVRISEQFEAATVVVQGLGRCYQLLVLALCTLNNIHHIWNSGIVKQRKAQPTCLGAIELQHSPEQSEHSGSQLHPNYAILLCGGVAVSATSQCIMWICIRFSGVQSCHFPLCLYCCKASGVWAKNSSSLLTFLLLPAIVIVCILQVEETVCWPDCHSATTADARWPKVLPQLPAPQESGDRQHQCDPQCSLIKLLILWTLHLAC